MKQTVKLSLGFLGAFAFIIGANAFPGQGQTMLSAFSKDPTLGQKGGRHDIVVEQKFFVPKETLLLSATSSAGERVSCRLSVVDDLKNSRPVDYTISKSSIVTGDQVVLKNGQYAEIPYNGKTKALVTLSYSVDKGGRKRLVLACDNMTFDDFSVVMKKMGYVWFMEDSGRGT